VADVPLAGAPDCEPEQPVRIAASAANRTSEAMRFIE
jgi:hypothetical protein